MEFIIYFIYKSIVVWTIIYIQDNILLVDLGRDIAIVNVLGNLLYR